MPERTYTEAEIRAQLTAPTFGATLQARLRDDGMVEGEPWPTLGAVWNEGRQCWDVDFTPLRAFVNERVLLIVSEYVSTMMTFLFDDELGATETNG